MLAQMINTRTETLTVFVPYNQHADLQVSSDDTCIYKKCRVNGL